jgi:hypothetical protein
MSNRNPAIASLKIEQRAQRQAARQRGRDGELDDALEATFPASDPVSLQAPVTAGGFEKPSISPVVEMAGERASGLQQLLMNEVRVRPFRALAWAAAAGMVLGIWAAR